MDFTVVKENLEKRGFTVSVFDTAADAAAYLNKAINGKSVGIGGSMTVEEMGLIDTLASHNTVHCHSRVPDGDTAANVIERAAASSVYLSSVNGLAETGEIINIDGRCNRVASTLYGHEKVFFIVGVNKIALDYEKALWRARNIAAPKNARRLNRKTPCAVKADKCYDCSSPERICRALCVLWEKPSGSDIEIVLVNENLGY